MSVDQQKMLLEHYESIRETSHAMLSAARSNDWDALVDAEGRCASLIKRVQAHGDVAAILDANGRKRKQEIILQVLADDAEIRTLTQPWVKQLERWLGDSRKARSVAAAYRA
jgi:flagellar protein FliT